VTTRDPGASDVFTHDFEESPASTAFFARRPAATITLGFEVFVHEVIAAITTDPSRTSFLASTLAGSGSGASAAPFVAPPSARNRPTSMAGGSGSSWSRNAATNDAHTSGSGTRSCGRLGPATLGSTFERSRSSVSLNVGSGSASVRNSPCSLVYRSTRSTTSPRAVNVRYRSVSTSTGQYAAVAPYSGHMFDSVARSAVSRVEHPGPKNSTNFPTTPCA